MTFEYAPAPESAALVNIKNQYGLFINGKFVAPKAGKTFTTINPATEEVLAKIGYAELADVNLAVAAARSAFEKTWAKMPAVERGKYLYRIARILQERSREFAWEAWHRNDMIRFGTYTTARATMTNTDAYRVLLPIPTTALLNPNITQNPGY